MEHRSDRYLRQDFLIPVLFDIIARQSINAELQDREELKELAKTVKGNDREAYLVQKKLHRLRRMYKIKSLNSGQILTEIIFQKLTKHCERFTLKIEALKRTRKLINTCSKDIENIFLSEKNKPDKLILVCLQIVEKLNEVGFIFEPFIRGLTNIFLQIEYLHNINEPVDNWELLKKSADKQSLKYIRKLQEYKYFTTIKAL